jgi:serine protease Do
MNSKFLITTLGLGALSVALVALPGSSAHNQDPTNPQVEQLYQALARAQDAERQIAKAQKGLQQLDIVQDLSDLEDDDTPVIVNTGRGWLGVGVSEVNSEKVKELKLPAERGALLGKIVPDSPAAKAGLKENDVITDVNGQRVEGAEQFRRMIREIPSGRAAQLTVWRDGRSQTLSVKIGKSDSRHTTTLVSPSTFAFNMPEMPQLNGMMEFGPWFPGHARLGIDAEDLEGDFGKFFGAPEGEGVLVRGVFSDSPAEKAGLKAGDVITSVDGDRIRSVGELREKMVDKKGEKSIKLGLLRNKAPLTLSVEIPAPAERQEHHNSVRTNI